MIQLARRGLRTRWSKVTEQCAGARTANASFGSAAATGVGDCRARGKPGWNQSAHRSDLTVTRRSTFPAAALLLGPGGNVVLRSDRTSIPVVSSAACWLVILESLVSVGMAVFLLIICLGLFRVPRKRVKPLELWSVAKILLSLVGGGAIAWMIESYLTNSTSPSPAAAHAGSVALSVGILVAALGCAYPIGVLITVRTRKVREYFEPTI